MEFLGNVFTHFIFEKYLSHEALGTGRVTAIPVTIKRSFSRGLAINEKIVGAI